MLKTEEENMRTVLGEAWESTVRLFGINPHREMKSLSFGGGNSAEDLREAIEDCWSGLAGLDEPPGTNAISTAPAPAAPTKVLPNNQPSKRKSAPTNRYSPEAKPSASKKRKGKESSQKQTLKAPKQMPLIKATRTTKPHHQKKIAETKSTTLQSLPQLDTPDPLVDSPNRSTTDKNPVRKRLQKKTSGATICPPSPQTHQQGLPLDLSVLLCDSSNSISSTAHHASAAPIPSEVNPEIEGDQPIALQQSLSPPTQTIKTLA